MSTKRGLFVVFVLILALAGAAMMTGCATTAEQAPTAERRQMVCAVLATGVATFEGSPRRFPSMRMVCDDEKLGHQGD